MGRMTDVTPGHENLKDRSGGIRRLTDGPEPEGPPPVSGEAVFASLQTAFAKSASACPDQLFESRYTFAGHSVRMRIVGRRLAEYLCLPFSHLRARDKAEPGPHLTIDLWDEEVTDIPCPTPLTRSAFGSQWRVANGLLTSSSDGRFVGYQVRQSLIWLDRQSWHILGWMASATQLSLYERGKPLHLLMSIWYEDRNVQIIHSGCVSRNGQGVLFPGMARAGKSTSALACLSAGFDYLGDDYVVLQAQDDGVFMGHSLYNSTWLELDHLTRFPALASHAIYGPYPWEEKPLILLSQVCPDRLAMSAEIRVLAFPRIVAARSTRWYPASKPQAFLQLAPSSLFAESLRPGARAFARLAQLIEHVPAYWLELGRDLSEIPERVQELLTEVHPHDAPRD